MKEIKARLYHLCEKYVDERIETSRLAIEAAQESANEEGKSSVGDKYETGRAMAQLEIEKNTYQLAEALKLKQTLSQIRIDDTPKSIQPGSLVVTDRAILFIAVSIGKLSLDGITYLVTGPAAPLAQKLMGSTVGASHVFNGESYTVKELH